MLDMLDDSTDIYNTDDEKQRYAYNMLPTYLLMKGSPEGKRLIKQATKNISRKPYRQKINFAQIFNELATTQTYSHIGMNDIKLEKGELSKHPYEGLLRSFGAETATELLRHTKLIDACLSHKLHDQLIIDFKYYMFETFGYEDSELNINMSAESFYLHLVLSFIAHLDARVHHAAYSEKVAPISLGWLFMHKLDPDKWQYNHEQDNYHLINNNGSSFTCTSRSFIHLLLTVLYFQKHKTMPTSLYGIRDKIDWKVEDEEGRLDEFIYKKSERNSKRNWLSLEDVFWLVGMRDSAKDETNEILMNWQQSFIKYIKTEDINDLKGLQPSAEAIIWFIYAFFQNIYEHTDKSNKANKEQGCVTYDDYYGLWESITDYYELRIDKNIRVERIQWSQYLLKQAMPIKRMT